jgi:hypothetical protein
LTLTRIDGIHLAPCLRHGLGGNIPRYASGCGI